jgi:hypothetical protein
MPANYVLLEKITVGAAGASSVTFSGIPQTGYTDLVLKASCRSDQSNVARSWKVQPNGVDITARNLDAENDPFVVFSGTSINMNTNGTGSTSNTFNNYDVYIPNYASTTTYKSLSVDGAVENNGTNANLKLVAGLYSSNTAISSITCIINAGSFVQNSTFYLYGTGGDTIMTDGTYWYHAFLSSGTFTPAKAITCDYLVVAGGGGGGKGLNAGGAGAGGLRSTVTATGGGGSLETPLSLGTSAYTVTVGAGGAGGVNNGDVGFKGSNSVFSTITSTGGGFGGAPDYGTGYKDGGPGGSGGGGGLYNTLGGAASPSGQGYAGGASVQDAGGVQAGGGGGAGAIGTTGRGTGPVLGTGGAGVQITAFATPTSTGVSGYYAGGGGGGANAGVAAGGAGGGATAGTSATANTGGGGGGAGNANGNVAGVGGSGIVIVRYAV